MTDHTACSVCRNVFHVDDGGGWCKVCSAFACDGCSSKWEAVDDNWFVCTGCKEVHVTKRDVFDELLRLYRLLPGADPAIKFKMLRKRLAKGRKTPLEKYEMRQKKRKEEDDST